MLVEKKSIFPDGIYDRKRKKGKKDFFVAKYVTTAQ